MTGWPAASSGVGEGVRGPPVVGPGQRRAARRRGRGRRRRTSPSGSRSTGTMPTPRLPVLSAMSCSTHAPKLRDLVVGEERQLVAAGAGQRADRQPSETPGLAAGSGSRQRAEHRDRRGEQRVEVEADERRRHEADVGQRRVAAADVGRVEEDLAQVVVVGDRLEALARVGDRDDERRPACSYAWCWRASRAASVRAQASA